MKKIVQLVLLFASVSFAQFITPNTGVTWDLDSAVAKSGGKVTGSFPNYVINDSIRVSGNDKFIVKAGSRVTFAANTQIEVNGVFQAAGEEQNPILFTCDTPDSTGPYKGIRFSDPSIDSLCFIKYTRINYAYYGMRAVNASPTFDNCYIYKCRRGADLSGSNAIIIENRIERSYEYGMNMTLGSNPYIIGNELLDNNTKNTSAMNQISIGLQGNNSPVIKNNKIYGSTNTKTGGISLWVYGTGAYSNIIIDNNIIHDNSFGITLYGSAGGAISGVVSNNVIYNNKINPDVMTTGSGINVNGGAANQPIIKRNVIYGNWWGITIQNGSTVQAGPQPNIGNIMNADTSDDGYNKIYNNIQGTAVYDLYNNCTNEIYAQNNDWGVYDSATVASHIFDKADDATHGQIYFTPFYKAPVIPVELASFSASQVSAGVLLRWLTVTEVNNSGFEVLKSVNGGSFEKIGFVKGAGNSTAAKSYEYKDANMPGVSQSMKYRLKQVDYDGSAKFSDVSEVNYVAPKKYELSQNYPNPFNPSTVINYQTANSGKVMLKVYNVLGKEVATLVNKDMPAGSHSVKFNAGNLSSGLYFYTLTAGNFTSTKKMILIK
jgi:hypothetical protein